MKSFVVLLAVFLCACATKAPQVSLTLDPQQQIVLVQHEAATENVQVLAKLVAPFLSHSPTPLDFAFAFSRPDKFRFEILDPLTLQTLLALGSDGDKAWWWEKGKIRRFKTSQLQKELQKLIGVRLSLVELNQLLLGAPRNWSLHLAAEKIVSAQKNTHGRVLHAEFFDFHRQAKAWLPRQIILHKDAQKVFSLTVQEFKAASALDPRLFSAYE